MRERARDPQDLLNLVGLFMVGRTQQAFRDQGRGGISWPGRAVPNRIGILRDLEAGRRPPERRFEARPAGIDTGRLRASIAYRVQGDSTVVVGSNLPYASDVQRGSTVSISVTGSLRTALAEWLKSLDGERKKQMRSAFGWLFRAGVFTSSVPARPFVMVTDDDRKQIRSMAIKFFAGGAR